MPKSVDVFTPNSFPTYTYVDRQGDPLEAHLGNALKTRNALISLSGPSKSGKTVLLNRLIDKNDLIYISGSSIRAAGDLWRIVLAWMGGSIASQQTSQVSGSISAKGVTTAQAGVLVAKGSVSGEVGLSGALTSSSSTSVAHDGLTEVAKEIAGSGFIVFVDDFHYINADVQAEVAREIKSGVERGIKICVASVPHRSDDVVRSNSELRGRIYSVDTSYWNVFDLKLIGIMGFSELNADIAPNVIDRLAAEAFGSPQLMQAMCLNMCFKKEIAETLETQRRVEISDRDMQEVFELTAAGTNFKSLVEKLHSGPRQRGTERKDFILTDGSKGDVYRAILLALRANPGQLSFNYEEMQKRVRSVCGDEFPAGGSVTRSLEQMDEIAEAYGSKAIEWLDDVLDVVDPYFLFYLRSSRVLDGLRS